MSAIIVELEARQGKTLGQMVGSYQAPGQNKMSQVSLPEECEAGMKYRVVLEEQPEKDGRGRAQFLAHPAPFIEEKDEWRDNGDGAISQIRTALNWRMERIEVAVLATRARGSRPRYSLRRGSGGRGLVLGNAPSTSFYEGEVVQVLFLQNECVRNGELVWEDDRGEKEIVSAVGLRIFPVISSEVAVMRDPHRNNKRGGCSGSADGIMFYNDRDMDALGTDPERPVRLDLELEVCPALPDKPGPWKPPYQRAESDSGWFKFAYSELPEWIRRPHEERFPICACGRCRVDAVEQNADGYTRCQKCRKEETCDWCGRKNTPVVMILERKTCQKCEPMASQADLVEQHLPSARRQEFAALAEKLGSGRALCCSDGEMVAKDLQSLRADPEMRSHFAKEYRGYPWYYLAGGAIWGSKFPPAALELLALLPQARGTGLVRLAAWVAGGVHRQGDLEQDFFFRTQVKGEDAPLALSAESLANASVAIKLVEVAAIREHQK